MSDLQKEQQLIRGAFEDFYEALDSKSVVILSEVMIQLDLTGGEVTISTPDEAVSVTLTVYAWISEDPDSLSQNADRALAATSTVIRQLKAEEFFERPIFQAPITVRYNDGVAPKDRILLNLSNDWSVTDTPLLPGMEKELQAFLSDLLAVH